MNFFDFLLDVWREYGLSAVLIMIIIFGYPRQVNKWYLKIIDEKDKEINRIAKSRDILQKHLLGSNYKSSINTNTKENNDE